jgi:hypothetical protein
VNSLGQKPRFTRAVCKGVGPLCKRSALSSLFLLIAECVIGRGSIFLRSALEGRKVPSGVTQPGGRQEILGKLSILFVALLSLYSPECVEGEFWELPIDGVLRSSHTSGSRKLPHPL